MKQRFYSVRYHYVQYRLHRFLRANRFFKSINTGSARPSVLLSGARIKERINSTRFNVVDIPIILLVAALILCSGYQATYLHGQTAAHVDTPTGKHATSSIIIRGIILDEDTRPLPSVTITATAQPTSVQQASKMGTRSKRDGTFEIALPKAIQGTEVTLTATMLGYKRLVKQIRLPDDSAERLTLRMTLLSSQQEQVVVTGTLNEVTISKSPVHIEVFSSRFLQKNPTPSIFEALSLVNGVQPQINCNVCYTGDIRINGMNGPYTMVTIDGMPIVSGLSTVYGLMGIPNSMIERVEVVKGPASTLYGSEAVGGLINIITKHAPSMPLFTVDAFATSQQEFNVDAAFKSSFGENDTQPAWAHTMLGVNYFNFQHRMDINNDNFTDVTLQHRISLFNKWEFEPSTGGTDLGFGSIAARFVAEDRFGGQMNWTPEFRGSDSIYGEAITTMRAEVIGKYRLPATITGGQDITLDVSFNDHVQDSYYGTTHYKARQTIAFAQAVWRSGLGGIEALANHDVTAGLAFRHTYYQDNTPATRDIDGITLKPSIIQLPGIFVQDEIHLSSVTTLLLAARYDYNSAHGNVFTPRLSLKYTPDSDNILRLNAGTGFRVVNLFTEDHAALSGAREVVIKNALRPEQSYNGNLSYTRYWSFAGDDCVHDSVLSSVLQGISIDATAFYTYFTNQITPDYDTDPTKIIYDNLAGYGVSAGGSLDVTLNFVVPLSVRIGVTYADVFQMRDDAQGIRRREQLFFAPRWSGTWALSYKPVKELSIDYTGRWTGAMRLPATLDPLPEESPDFALHNLQVSYRLIEGERGLPALELYGGAKNLFNYLPREPVIIRAFDPFDRLVQNPTTEQTFDPTRVYTPLQGIRAFLGVRANVW